MLEVVLSSITFFLNTFLGLFAFIRNSRNWTNRLFFLLALLINAYIIINYVSLHPPTQTSQLFWIRLVMFVCSFIGPTLLILVHTFPRARITLKTYQLVLLYLLCISSASASLSPYVFSSLSYPNGKPVPNPGPAIPIFFFDFVGLFVFSFVLLILKYRKSKGIERMQHLLFLIGIIGTFSLMAVTTVIFVVILKFSDLVFLGPISTLFLVICLAYAIIKHRFLDIRLIVVRSVVYALILLILGGGFTVYLLFIGTTLFNISFSLREYLFYGTIMFVIAFAFQPLQRMLEEATDKIFYKGYYDSQSLLRSLSAIMSSTISLEQLTEKILTTMLEQMRLNKGAFVLLSKKDEEGINYISDKGYTSKPEFAKDDVDLFISSDMMLIFDELDEGILKERMRVYELAVALPMIVQEEQVGILCLGQKRSGEIYSDQDITVLEILGPQLAIAIQNSREYEEIKRFNITLKEEVNNATKELKEANEKLKQLDRMKDEFVSLASHELRTPMTVIKSYLWMTLNGKGGPLSEKQKFYLDRTYRSTDRLITFVNEMLNVSRIESNRITIQVKSVALDKLIKEIVNELEPRAKELNVNVTITPFEHLPMVQADSDKIREVIINLVGNSLKFTKAGGSITISFKVLDNLVETDIKDTGIGLTTDDIPKLFHKFGMVGDTYLTKSNSQGTGLGLYISKSIIELHGGKIWASSEGSGKGSLFSFTLKRAGTAESVQDDKE